MKKLICFGVGLGWSSARAGGPAGSHQIDVTKEGGVPIIAIPDFRGSGDAQTFMAAFNETLYARREQLRACFKIVPKTSLPLFVPQQPSDFQQPPPPPAAPPRRRAPQMTQATNGGGRWMPDWSSPPAQAQLPGLRLHGGAERRLGAAGLALRPEQGQPGQRAGDRQPLPGIGGRSRRAESGPRIRRRYRALFGGQVAVRHAHLLRLQPDRPQRNLGDGLRTARISGRSRISIRISTYPSHLSRTAQR